ncbi:NAD-dependent epimerase/dehydratase family protein (plasmid) [Streptomyces sp. BHT-5-2]|nr:NAD-dependent epimerase/dehydratase family protein [Streptomyces sp. BHT-5-2]
MRVLVTGGAGFIGSQVVEALLGRGHEPVVLDALLPSAHPEPPPPPPGVHRVVEDVRDRAAVETALAGVDAVCHQAAMVGLGKDFADAPDYVGCNDLGTAVLLAAMAASGVRRLVLAGSMVVYGEGHYSCPAHGAVRPGPRAVAELEAGRFEPDCPRCGAALLPGLVHEDAPVDPRNVYAATKLAQEHLAASWARATGGRAIALRYHNVYGPGMPRDTPYAGVASFFRSALARGESPTVYEDGGQRRDFVHVRDVAAANIVALEALPERREGTLTAYNTGSGRPHTVGEMACTLAEAYGGPAPVVTGEYRLGDVRHITASSRRIADELGWRAETGFAEGMAEFAREGMREGPEQRAVQRVVQGAGTARHGTGPAAGPAGGGPGPAPVDVVLPCLNEAAALPWVLARIPDGWRAVVVDNGSTDGSAEVARGLGATVVHEPRRGFGAACHAGLLAAEADIVCFCDCDASLDPALLAPFVHAVRDGESDLVLGRRRPQGRGAWPPHARAGNVVLARMLRRRTGLRLHDLGPLRAARRDALIGLDLTDRRSGYPLQMVVRAADAGWRIEERDVPYRPRTGRSKVTGTWRGTWHAVRDMRRVLNQPPLTARVPEVAQ